MPVQLDGIPETLLITIRARAEETKRSDALIQDRYAVEILDKLDLNQTESIKNNVAASSKIGIIIRTTVLDNIVMDFLKRKPEGIVIALGCGLDARYERLNCMNTPWYDLDVEEAIEIRKRFFTEKNKYRMIAKSMFDYSWMDEVPKDKPVLILSEGVMMYFPEEQLRPMINQIFNTFPDIEMAFDTIPPFLAKRTNLHTEVKKYNVKFQWGLGATRELEQWNKHIAIRKEAFYVDYYPHRWPLSIRILSLLPKIRKWNKIVHIESSR